jgi:hypothetical protein
MPFGNNSALGLSDEVVNAYAATITVNPNLGSKHTILTITGDFNLAIDIDTDTDLLYLYIHNTDVSARTLTWSTNVLSYAATESLGAGTKWMATFFKAQSKWCKASFIQVA